MSLKQEDLKEMGNKIKLYNTKFEELFDSKEQAVIQYLSLERRFLEIYKQLREYMKILKEVEKVYLS